MHNGPRLQALIAEYGQLRRLDGHTPQSRGQAFNDLIADMLRCWGHRAESSVFAKGEADVVFRIGEVRYVLEAKWENRSADTGYIAKLQRRLRQRFAGTPGVFLSMGGYSPDALAEIADGEQLQVLLMDATHFEAMLSGLVPPKELFTQLHDRASFYGEPYVPLLTLIGSSEDPPSVAFGTPDMMPDGLVTDTNAVVTGEVLFTLPTSLRLGVGIDPQGHVLVTTDQGILAVDIQSRRSRWAVSVAECHGNPVVRADGAVLFTRRHGVGRLANNQVTVIGGGLFGTTRLAPHPDGTVWAFASGGTDGRSGASIARLGDKLGDEERHSLAYPSDAATTSAWIDHDDLLTIGPELLITTVATAQLRRHRAAQANATGLVSIGDGTVITSGDNVTLGRTDLLSGRFSHLADLGLRPAAHELCTGHEGTLLIAAHYGNGMETPIAVGRIALTAPSETTTRNVIENRDADALAGGPSLCGPPRRLVQQQLTFDLDTLSKTVTARDLPARSAQHRPPVTDETPVDPAPTDLREPTVVDVFAGSGGVTLGFVQEGYRPIFAVDIDLAAATTYAANFGESLTYRGDIQNVESRGLGHADVFIGAPPTRG
ncbi:DNA cytosine methyltransferase [Paractinoplanes hotanensis]|uniref:DNA cytosine methyltransferase n=1 Tax=Paractinoplanes hotanensis TaxID=2906497 RepID=A0ABT0Y8F8_9ACTN|nr:DNA cytosine methyltransferase [Actinoplanes hotanensis]MCM4082336.1 DNA cytosine methyltransferase [Actinoplanes hotanensis]